MIPPKVSVLLPVRNGSPYFAAALDSILTQTEVDFEAIVVDDGSSDDTPALLAACTDPRLRTIRLDGGGLVNALNTGLAHARGEYIARMDADDIALPGRLSRQAALLDSHPEFALVHGSARLIDDKGNEFGIIPAEQLSREDRRAVLMADRVGPHIVHPTVMIRKAVLDSVGGYRAIPSCEDHDLWLRLSERHQFLAIPEPILMYRQHSGGISRENAVTQAISNLLNCVCAEFKAERGIDIFDKRPEHYRAMRKTVEDRAGKQFKLIATAQQCRRALRQGRFFEGVGRWLQLVRAGQPLLILTSQMRARHRSQRVRLLAELLQQI